MINSMEDSRAVDSCCRQLLFDRIPAYSVVNSLEGGVIDPIYGHFVETRWTFDKSA